MRQWQSADAWLRARDACACPTGRKHRNGCSDTDDDATMLGYLMSRAPFENDSPVILTAGLLPDGRVPHGSPSHRIPNPTGQRDWTDADGVRTVAERKDYNPRARAARRTAAPIRTRQTEGPRDTRPEVSRLVSIVGRIGNVE